MRRRRPRMHPGRASRIYAFVCERAHMHADPFYSEADVHRAQRTDLILFLLDRAAAFVNWNDKSGGNANLGDNDSVNDIVETSLSLLLRKRGIYRKLATDSRRAASQAVLAIKVSAPRRRYGINL